jgi:ABC-2 type transport system permease protein
MYAFVFAALGALVSRQEDVGGATAPAVMLIIMPYVAGISILPSDPDNGPMALLSLIPFFSPMPGTTPSGRSAPPGHASSTRARGGGVVLGARPVR